ncbi:MAG: hypothetical protein KKB82_01440 [Candidatus Omnitrophica bacterium]|nr:hypothetical protein [Candidatus Omnitrophota bacterium]MBU1924567.1 hypothetical protein [Candidatus Omnitrophota bacterium]
MFFKIHLFESRRNLAGRVVCFQQLFLRAEGKMLCVKRYFFSAFYALYEKIKTSCFPAVLPPSQTLALQLASLAKGGFRPRRIKSLNLPAARLAIVRFLRPLGG